MKIFGEGASGRCFNCPVSHILLLLTGYCVCRKKRKQSLCIIIDLLTCEDVRHCVLILSCPEPARLVQETTPGSGWTVSKAEQGREVQSISREVVAKLIGIGGMRWRTTW